jgi:hypothetical protein
MEEVSNGIFVHFSAHRQAGLSSYLEVNNILPEKFFFGLVVVEQELAEEILFALRAQDCSCKSIVSCTFVVLSKDCNLGRQWIL